MSGAAPRVTAIMATYNWSSVLPFSIASALEQSFGDFELLVVGDGCTDDSADVVQRVADGRVRWIALARNHGHQSAANNEGLRQARGELIAYLGHDDLWLPHHLALLVAAIDRGADLAYGIARVIAPSAPAIDGAHAVPDFGPRSSLPPSAVVHTRALAEVAGGWRDHRETGCEPDGELWQRFHAAGARIEAVPRLTAVKFPAAVRPDVYRSRPCHEQAEWLARIRGDEDFEAVELGRSLMQAVARQRARFYAQLVAELARRTASGLLRRLTPVGPRRRYLAMFERRRRYKGAAPRMGKEEGRSA